MGVLYMMYLATILNHDTKPRFGYADDIGLYRVGKNLQETTTAIGHDVANILAWGNKHRLAFAPDKLEMVHITNKRKDADNPTCFVNDTLTIEPVPLPTRSRTAGNDTQPALRWLGIWFDRKLTFRRHVAKRVGKARRVAQHIRALGRIRHGPPAVALRKAMITCVLPSLLYGIEVWYAGRTK